MPGLLCKQQLPREQLIEMCLCGFLAFVWVPALDLDKILGDDKHNQDEHINQRAILRPLPV